MRLSFLAIAAITCLPATALADSALDASMGGYHETERSWVLELIGGKVFPNIDRESGLTGNPYADIFGENKRMWLFQGELDYQLWQGFGSLSVGLAAGYGSISGKGIVASTGQASPDETSLKLIPLTALAVYRLDWLYRQLGIPLVPFGKAGLAHTIWWATNGEGDVPRFEGGKAFGGKWGYELAGGLAFELNFLEPDMGREFDQDFGVNSVYLYAEYVKRTADNFKKSSGIDLSSNSWMFGIGFEF